MDDQSLAVSSVSVRLEHMFETVRSAVRAVREALGDLDAEALSGPAAAEMLGVFSELAAVAQAGLTVAAGAVARTNAWAASGARSARAYVSGTAGVSVGSAERGRSARAG